jgi:hypothetical protein
MQRLCQAIATSHAQRQALRKDLRAGALRLRREAARRRHGFQMQFETFRGELRAARMAWQKAATVMARKRRRPR